MTPVGPSGGTRPKQAWFLSLFRVNSSGVDAVFASNHINFPTFRDPALGEGGHAAFAASLLKGNVMTESIWLADPSSELKMVARQGDPAPGTDDIFTDFGTSTVNARGQLAFTQELWTSARCTAASGRRTEMGSFDQSLRPEIP